MKAKKKAARRTGGDPSKDWRQVYGGSGGAGCERGKAQVTGFNPEKKLWNKDGK